MRRQSPWIHHRISSATQKTSKPWHKIRRRKGDVRCPRLPRFSPQPDHKNTTSTCHFSQNTPEKRRKRTHNLFAKNHPRTARTSPTTSSTVIEVRHRFRSTMQVSRPHPQHSVL